MRRCAGEINLQQNTKAQSSKSAISLALPLFLPAKRFKFECQTDFYKVPSLGQGGGGAKPGVLCRPIGVIQIFQYGQGHRKRFGLLRPDREPSSAGRFEVKQREKNRVYYQ